MTARPAAAQAETPCSSDAVLVQVTVMARSGPAQARCFDVSDVQGVSGPRVDATYEQCSPGGCTPTPVTSGLAVRTLVDAVVPDSSITFVQLSVPGSPRSASRLGRTRCDDLADTADSRYAFADRDAPPVLFLDGGDSIEYLRSARRAQCPPSGHDYTQYDQQQASTDQPLHLDVHTSGQVVFPTLVATPTTVAAGASVQFRAAPVSGDAGESFTWSASFGDGDTSSPGPALVWRHGYRNAGTYYAHVEVVGSDGSVGQSSPIAITVGPAPNHPTSPPATTGPNQGNGGAHAPVGGPVSGTGTRPGGAPTGAPSGAVAAPGPTGSAAGASGGGASARRGTEPGRGSDTARPGAAFPAAAGRVVGFVVAGGAPAGGSTRHAAAPAARSAVRTTDLGAVLTGVAAGVSVLVLLGAGVATELRRPGRRRR